MQQDNKQRVIRFFTGVFNEGDMSPIDDLIGEGYTYNGAPADAAGTRAWAEGLRATFADLHFNVEDILAEDDKVAIRWRMFGTDPRSGVRVTTSGTNIITFRDGKAISNFQGGGKDPEPVHPGAYYSDEPMS